MAEQRLIMPGAPASGAREEAPGKLRAETKATFRGVHRGATAAYATGPRRTASASGCDEDSRDEVVGCAHTRLSSQHQAGEEATTLGG